MPFSENHSSPYTRWTKLSLTTSQTFTLRFSKNNSTWKWSSVHLKLRNPMVLKIILIGMSRNSSRISSRATVNGRISTNTCLPYSGNLNSKTSQCQTTSTLKKLSKRTRKLKDCKTIRMGTREILIKWLMFLKLWRMSSKNDRKPITLRLCPTSEKTWRHILRIFLINKGLANSSPNIVYIQDWCFLRLMPSFRSSF